LFNSIRGEITGRGPNTLCLTTQGVEWELEVSGFTLRKLAAEDSARVYTHLHHRDDQMRLFGFATGEERRVFLELTRVSGIGPRAAIRILSATSPERLIQLLESEDVDGLVLLPGLGRKTAQKIILSLRGKLVAAPEGAGPGHTELVDGLVEMGFERGAATRVVTEITDAVREEYPDLSDAEVEQEVFRRAIVALSAE
jgi:Holliday junction DNA helicase RuvA